jgi:hypothetical protein
MKWSLLDIFAVMVILPIVIGATLVASIYWVMYFPIWWIRRVVVTRKRWLKWRDIDIL